MTEVLRTERLILRPFVEGDLNDYFEYFLNPDVRSFLGGFPPGDRENAAILFRANLRREMCWAVELDGKVIGEALYTSVVCGYLANIGYVFNKNFWGRGYAAEAVKRLVRHGFEDLGFGRVRAETVIENTRSQRLLERCGFEREALIYEADFGGRVADVFYYGISETSLN